MASILKNKVVIIDYNSGNIKSLGNMLSYLGCDYILSNKKEDILNAKKLIFPGQGHFAQAMDNLEKSGLIDTIKTSINNGIDFLGICLGLQILFEKSEEAPNIEGLGIIKGEVKKAEEIISLTALEYHQIYNVYLNLKEYSNLFETYIYYYGNERLKGQYKALKWCARRNYKKTRDTVIELIKEDLLPSVDEMRAAIGNI